MTRSETSRSADTVLHYRKRGAGLVCAYKRRTADDPFGWTWTAFAEDLIAQCEKLGASTWRQYRCAARLYLSEKVAKGASERERADLHEALRLLATISAGTAPAQHTSANKEKVLRAQELADVCAASLRRTAARYARCLNLFLRVNVICGLRGSEWPSATIDETADGGAVVLKLIIRNGKFGQGRGNGPVRTLIFRSLSPHDRRMIRTWLGIAAEAQRVGDYPRLINGMSALLRSICDKLYPRRKRHATLSSTRHQFASMAKLVYSREEVAALMGHAVDTTAGTHYGRPPRGGLTPEEQAAISKLPKPSPEEVATVRRKFERKIESRDRLKVLRKQRSM